MVKCILNDLEILEFHFDYLKKVFNDQNLKEEYKKDIIFRRFRMSIELFWKVLKKILETEKIEVSTPRQVMQQAFQNKLIDDEKIWFSMLDDRNISSHMYDEQDALRIRNRIQDEYFKVMNEAYKILKQKYKQ